MSCFLQGKNANRQTQNSKKKASYCKQNEEAQQNQHQTKESHQSHRQMWQAQYSQCQSRESKPDQSGKPVPRQTGQADKKLAHTHMLTSSQVWLGGEILPRRGCRKEEQNCFLSVPSLLEVVFSSCAFFICECLITDGVQV